MPVSLRMPRRAYRRLPGWARWLQYPAVAVFVALTVAYTADTRPPAWRVAMVVVVLTALGWGVEKAGGRFSGDYQERHPWLFAGAQTLSILVLLAVPAMLLKSGQGGGYLLGYGVMWFFVAVYKAKRGEDARYDDDFPLMTRRDALDDRDDGSRWRTGTP
jgi:hypothetical protein